MSGACCYQKVFIHIRLTLKVRAPDRSERHKGPFVLTAASTPAFWFQHVAKRDGALMECGENIRRLET